ncbi:MAG TPA: hypothetical protein VFM70_02855 [Salinimicrobium sp.]|nr:hypothetical protein [Salinimicrobium sp.]
MSRYIQIFLLCLIFSSCDDGDIIVTNFDFGEDENLRYCESGNTKVLYKINNDNFESLSLNFINNDFSGTTEELEENEILEFHLDENNSVVYRTYSNNVPDNYFCNAIPPTEPEVLEEFWSTGGVVQFIISAISGNDDDNVPQEEEDLSLDGNNYNDDTDEDGIPDFLDVDDDGDGILTTVEIVNPDLDNEEYPDTDNDGIPNYLDADDDNDGILTIHEDADGDGDPRNDYTEGNELPNYLEASAAETFDPYELPENEITRNFRTVVRITGMTLTNGTETITEATQMEFGTFEISNVEVVLTGD